MAGITDASMRNSQVAHAVLAACRCRRRTRACKNAETAPR